MVRENLSIPQFWVQRIQLKITKIADLKTVDFASNNLRIFHASTSFLLLEEFTALFHSSFHLLRLVSVLSRGVLDDETISRKVITDQK
jgi:hypothetical protein